MGLDNLSRKDLQSLHEYIQDYESKLNNHVGKHLNLWGKKTGQAYYQCLDCTYANPNERIMLRHQGWKHQIWDKDLARLHYQMLQERKQQR